MSESTVLRRLKEQGLYNLEPRRVPKLSEGNKLDRFNFCVEHETFDWNKVLFTDEATFRLDKISHKVWRAHGEEVNLPIGPREASVSVWGCFCASGFGQLVVIEGSMNMVKYCEIFENTLIPSIDELFGGMD